MSKNINEFQSITSLAARLPESDRGAAKEILDNPTLQRSNKNEWIFSLLDSLSAEDKQAFGYALDNTPDLAAVALPKGSLASLPASSQLPLSILSRLGLRRVATTGQVTTTKSLLRWPSDAHPKQSVLDMVFRKMCAVIQHHLSRRLPPPRQGGPLRAPVASPR